MMWLESHLTTILTVWSALWALASVLQSVFPSGSVAWKVCHVVLALSPADFVKALKTVGSGVVPPVAGAMLCLALVGCASASPPPGAPGSAVDPRALARASVSLLEDAWVASAKGCLAAAEADQDDTIRAKCESVLTPARNMLLAASDGVDVWTDADQRNFPCLITSAAAGIGQVTTVVPGLHLPQLVSDGLSLAQSYAGRCSP
jgi:hypothetical protein